MTMDTQISIGSLCCKNPVWVAAGTFLYGREYGRRLPLDALGAICTKGTSLEPWDGVQGIRIAETPAGMLNAIGLQNWGIDAYLARNVAWLREQDATIVVNIVGKTVEEYAAVAAKLSPRDADAIEVNISCPNVSEGGVFFGTDLRMTEKVVDRVRKATSLPVIVKLAPNTHGLAEFARAAEAYGADALSVANCIPGMAIDIRRRKAVMGTPAGSGGLSGPAVKPIILKMVWDVTAAVRIPVIGVGGVASWQDAVEYLMAGASAVQVGSALFRNPNAPWDVAQGLEQFMRDEGVNSIGELIGAARP